MVSPKASERKQLLAMPQKALTMNAKEPALNPTASKTLETQASLPIPKGQNTKLRAGSSPKAPFLIDDEPIVIDEGDETPGVAPALSGEVSPQVKRKRVLASADITPTKRHHFGAKALTTPKTTTTGVGGDTGSRSAQRQRETSTEEKRVEAEDTDTDEELLVYEEGKLLTFKEHQAKHRRSSRATPGENQALLIAAAKPTIATVAMTPNRLHSFRISFRRVALPDIVAVQDAMSALNGLGNYALGHSTFNAEDFRSGLAHLEAEGELKVSGNKIYFPDAFEELEGTIKKGQEKQ